MDEITAPMSFLISCPQARTTRQLWLLKYAVFFLSLARLFLIFVFQKSFFKIFSHLGYCQPCQKSLSKKTQTFSFWKTMSGLPRKSLAFILNFLTVLFFNSDMKSFSNRVFDERIFDIISLLFRFENLSMVFCIFLFEIKQNRTCQGV